jgi:AbrB family looped-hinge helix DNA binding protein
MGAVLISTKGQIVLPKAVRQALGLKPGMRVDVTVEGKNARIAPAPEKHTVSLKEIQSRLKYEGSTVAISDMRVTEYKR